ncbi:MAG: hypothetical protein ACOH1T_03100 [Microbacteriaceae bacterium]
MLIDDPDELHFLIFKAIDHALNSLEPGQPLLPFAFVETAEGVKLERAVADKLEEMIELTRQIVTGQSDASRAVIVWDGYSRVGGTRVDTVFIEGYERGAVGGILVTQPYKVAGMFKKRIELAGQGSVVERGRPPLF